MSLPTPYTVIVRQPSAGQVDEFGNESTVWAEVSWAVHAIQPGAMQDADRSNRDLSVVAWTILGPKTDGRPVSSLAQVRLPGDTRWYQVDGEPADWTLGPWPHPTAGMVVELRRADG